MVISMKLHSTGEEIEQVCKRIEHFGYKVHSIEGEERVVELARMLSGSPGSATARRHAKELLHATSGADGLHR